MSLILISVSNFFSFAKGSAADEFPAFKVFALSQSTTSRNFSCKGSKLHMNGVRKSNIMSSLTLDHIRTEY